MLVSVQKQKEAVLLRQQVLDKIFEEVQSNVNNLTTRETELTNLLGKHADDAALRIFSTDDILTSSLGKQNDTSSCRAD